MGGRVGGRVGQCVAAATHDRLAGCIAVDRLADRLAGWLADRLAGWLVGGRAG